MTNWIGPEWLPTIPQSDVGTFLCYILWVEDTRQYYVGQTVDPKRSMSRAFRRRSDDTRGDNASNLYGFQTHSLYVVGFASLRPP